MLFNAALSFETPCIGTMSFLKDQKIHYTIDATYYNIKIMRMLSAKNVRFLCYINSTIRNITNAVDDIY